MGPELSPKNTYFHYTASGILTRERSTKGGCRGILTTECLALGGCHRDPNQNGKLKT